MVRVSAVVLVMVIIMLLAGCARLSGHSALLWQSLESETSMGPSDAWIDAHPTDDHMHCFPFYCH